MIYRDEETSAIYLKYYGHSMMIADDVYQRLKNWELERNAELEDPVIDYYNRNSPPLSPPQ